MNPLNSVAGAIIVGVVLAVLLTLGLGTGDLNHYSLARWLHLLSGVMWIGLLYYFNVARFRLAARRRQGGPGRPGITSSRATIAVLVRGRRCQLAHGCVYLAPTSQGLHLAEAEVIVIGAWSDNLSSCLG